jgi:hypothetical protein
MGNFFDDLVDLGGDLVSGIGGAIGMPGVDMLLGYNSAKEADERSYSNTRSLRQTAYQDTVSSMRAAGINPLMAIKNGPVSQGQFQTRDKVSQAMINANNAADLRQKKAATDLLKQQEKTAWTQAQKNTYDSAMVQTQMIYQDMINSIQAMGLQGELSKAKLSSDSPIIKKLQLIMESIGLKTGTLKK